MFKQALLHNISNSKQYLLTTEMSLKLTKIDKKSKKGIQWKLKCSTKPYKVSCTTHTAVICISVNYYYKPWNSEKWNCITWQWRMWMMYILSVTQSFICSK